MAAVDTRPLKADDLDDLGRLFVTARGPRHCWCTAFCSTTMQFAAGWMGGGNRRRFETMATVSATPMGVLAAIEPVGWCACGPRSRYAVAVGRSPLIGGPRAEDETVWLIACLFVRPTHHGFGVTHALVRAAVALARGEGAVAIEGWPIAATIQKSADAFFGRESLFRELGFSLVERPTPRRAIVRLDLAR